MAISISRYVDPGVYIAEVIVPGAVSVTSERTLALFAIAPRTRRSVDEAVIRGKIYEEALTLSVGSPHVATLSNTSNRSRNSAQLYMNGNPLGLADWAFLPARLVGGEWAGGVPSGALPASKTSTPGPWNLTSGMSFTLAVDAVPAAPALFTGTRASAVGGAVFPVGAVGAGDSMGVIIGGVTYPVVAVGGETLAFEIANLINTAVAGGGATITGAGTGVDIFCDIEGLDSEVELVAGPPGTDLLAQIGHIVGVTAGGGTVGNIHAVTAADYETVVEAACPPAAVTVNIDGSQTTKGVVLGVIGLLDFVDAVPGTLTALGILAPLLVNGVDPVLGSTVDVSIATGTPYLTLALDGKRAVTLDLDAAVTAVGGAPAAATASEVCDAINYELGNVAGTYYSIYGVTYAGVATHAAGIVNQIITITSPSSETVSDVKVFISPISALDAASALSDAAWTPAIGAGIQAPTRVQVYDSAYTSTAAYTLDYVSVDVLADVLANAGISTPLSDINYVGSYPGGVDYLKNTDYEVGIANDVDWDVTTWAQATATTVDFVASPPTIVGGTNDKLLVSINGRTQVQVTLTPGAPTTPAQVALDINAALAAIGSAYGPEFSHMAAVVGNTVRIRCPDDFENYLPEKGVASSIQFRTVAANAFATLFGAITLPYTVSGTGKRPAFGTSYYTTYDYIRPSTDYTTGHRVYDPDQLYQYTTKLTMQNYLVNKLCVAGEIAFENGISSMYLFQINDAVAPGTPTQLEINAALDVAKEYSTVTDVVTIDTGLDTTVYQMLHVADQSSMLEKHYRRGWFGMARGTDVGDPDTANTFVYRSTKTLQPGNTSPGRGRLFLVAPGEATRTIKLDTSQEVDLNVDGSYIAVAVAAVFTALPSPSSALIGKFITGFKTEGFGTHLRGERHTLADKGVLVVTLDAGRLVMLDPISTEAGGAKVVQFEEPASSAQKDAVTKTVDTLLAANVVGVVPDDLSDFISDCKKWILLGITANINNGTIAAYRDQSGLPRDIDATIDILVYQSTTDPRTFYFKYWYNLKYPAKRFFGEYSVDNPFFSPA